MGVLRQVTAHEYPLAGVRPWFGQNRAKRCSLSEEASRLKLGAMCGAGANNRERRHNCCKTRSHTPKQFELIGDFHPNLPLALEGGFYL